MNRYLRQQLVPGFGLEGQAQLKQARVLVIGAGGLAAPVLPYLVGAGVGQITLLDPDRVDRSNLHRQTLFGEHCLGALKVFAAQQRLLDLNPDCSVHPFPETLDPANVAAWVKEQDLVLDCADSFAVSYILSDECTLKQLPLISASVLGWTGYVGAFCGGKPSLRAVFPELPSRLGNCAQEGVLGPLVGILGSLQAQWALALLTQQKPSPLGRLVTLDGLTSRFGGFDFSTAPEPTSGPRFIAPNQIRPDDFLVDLRAVEEAVLVRSDAQRWSVEEVSLGKRPPDSAQRVVLCCRSGLRSWQAAEHLVRSWPGEVVLVALGDLPPLESPR